MNVLITGATGFLGRYIVNEFINNDINPVVLVRDKNKIPEAWVNIDVIIGDINDDLSSQLSNLKIDCIIHNAAKTPGADLNNANNSILRDEFFRVNTEGTKNMVLLGKKLNCRSF